MTKPLHCLHSVFTHGFKKDQYSLSHAFMCSVLLVISYSFSYVHMDKKGMPNKIHIRMLLCFFYLKGITMYSLFYILGMLSGPYSTGIREHIFV